ncbi:MAG: RIP metalloprotease RseP [Alphaproteobacteria bacterium]
MFESLLADFGYGNFILVLSILIFVHEMGHYLVAKWCGVRVETFSIGFYKEIVGWTDKSGTRWKIGFLPLGGYVKMFGEHSVMNADGTQKRPMTPNEKQVSFSHKSLAQRTAVVAAGPGANFLFAIVVLAFVYAVIGKPDLETPAASTLGSVVEGSAAKAAGLQPGDTIVGTGNVTIRTFEDLRQAVLASAGDPMPLVYVRDGVENRVTVTPRMSEFQTADGAVEQRYLLGVRPMPPEYRPLGPVDAVSQGVGDTWNMTVLTLSAVGEIILGDRGTDELGGPVRIAELSNDAAQSGGLAIVGLMVLLSINLGLINLFPIPMLDGGHLLFYAIEAMRGKPVSERIQEFSLRIGLAFILCLMVFVTVNDFVNLGWS